MPHLDPERPCSVARSLEIIGDRWVFLLLREAFFGVRRFDEFHRQLGIARNILADRLKRLVEGGVLERHQYQDRPPRYEYRLTDMGRDLYPIILGIIGWGDRWLADESGPPLALTHTPCGHALEAKTVCAECRAEVRARDVTYGDGAGAARMRSTTEA